MKMPDARPINEAPSWLVWAALWVVYIVWGSTYLAIKVMVDTLPVLLASGVRFLIAGAVVYLFLLVRRGRAGVRVTRNEVLASALVGGALLLGGNGMVGVAEKQGVSSGLTALIIASVPLWVVILRKVFGEKISGVTLVSVLVGFSGVAMLVLSANAEPGQGPDQGSIAAMLLIVAASFSWASGSFFSKRLPLPKDPFLSTGMQMLLGGLILVAGGAIRGEFTGIDIESFSTRSVVALVYLITAGSLLAFTAYTWLLQNAPISKVATYAYVNPVIAVALGALIENEKITGTIIVGAAIIVASVAFIVTKESSNRPASQKEPRAVPSGTAAEAMEMSS